MQNTNPIVPISDNVSAQLQSDGVTVAVTTTFPQPPQPPVPTPEVDTYTAEQITEQLSALDTRDAEALTRYNEVLASNQTQRALLTVIKSAFTQGN